MDYENAESWDETRWEQEYEALMEIARTNLDPNWEHGEVVVLRTVKGSVYVAQIPDYWDADAREPLENRCIEKLASENDTEVLCCLTTIKGKTPDISSWNFRERLIMLNEKNLQTETFLWGGDDTIFLKPFHRLLPPNYQIRNEDQITE